LGALLLDIIVEVNQISWKQELLRLLLQEVLGLVLFISIELF
jgi:hypothetical protein